MFSVSISDFCRRNFMSGRRWYTDDGGVWYNAVIYKKSKFEGGGAMYHEKIRSQILEGSLADFPGHLSGVYRGYHVSIQNRNAQFIVKINAHM